MVHPSAWNHFDDLATSFGREDSFTSSLASLMVGVPEARDAFLGWVDEHVREHLTTRTWRVRAQVEYETDDLGLAVLDMVLASDDLELWFEHKLGAREGIRTAADGREVTQLVKYQQARERYEVLHPDRRVLLFYITSDPNVVDALTIGTRHVPGGRGFVWAGLTGALAWRDLFPRMRDALTACVAKRAHDFRTQLFQEFLAWWVTLPAMSDATPSPDLHPNDTAERAGLWPLATQWLRGKLPGSYHNYGGSNIEGRPDEHRIDYVLVEPREPSKVPTWNTQEFGTDILQVAFRVPGLEPPREDGWLEQDRRWPILVVRQATDKGLMVRMFVGLTDWSSRIDDTSKQRGILGAVQAAVHAFERVTGIDAVGRFD